MENKQVITLTQSTPSGGNQPKFTAAEILPGRGMNIYQLRAYVPGHGVIPLLDSPPVEQGLAAMNSGAGDEFGNESFKVGGAILAPFANRIRGKLSPDGKSLTTNIAGKPFELPANFKGKEANAEVHSIHGLILAKAFQVSKRDPDRIEASLDAGNSTAIGLQELFLTFASSLLPDSFTFSLTAKNVGEEDLPMGIGWHPYFVFPSGHREQARLHVPATERVLVNNYDDVFPTGEVVRVAGTAYDFSAPGGAAFQKLFLDDCFVNIQKKSNGASVAEIIDPEAKYGLRITSLSPEVAAFQAYAPVNKPFVAFEPQFNWGDPFSPVWKGRNTGMVMLKPGASVTYSVRLELLVP